MNRQLLISASLGLVLIAFILAAVVVTDIRNDRRTQVDITADTELLLHPRPRAQDNQSVEHLIKGQPVRVLRIRYGKDFMAVKVRTENGKEGWLIVGENPFEIRALGAPHNSSLQPIPSRITASAGCNISEARRAG